MELVVDPSLAAALGPVTREVSCKICPQRAALHGVADFNKSCEIEQGRHFPLSGIPVWYHRCRGCGFVFSAQFDAWTPAMFRTHIYNAQYLMVDPDMKGTRAEIASHRLIACARERNAANLLDFGGGEGHLARILSAKGLVTRTWDPFLTDDEPPEAGIFDLVSCYEVLEHSPTPRETCARALSFLKPGGVMVFSTLSVDDLPRHSMDHWYIAPRNGHISIHTKRSLAVLFGELGWRVRQVSPAVYMAVAASG